MTILINIDINSSGSDKNDLKSFFGVFNLIYSDTCFIKDNKITLEFPLSF